MDNIFGKEDSGDERTDEHKDVEEHKDNKNSPAKIVQNSESKDTEAMEIDNVQIKV